MHVHPPFRGVAALLLAIMLIAPARAGQDSAATEPASRPAELSEKPASTETQPATEPCEKCALLSERESLTNHWFGLGEKLSQHGVDITLALTQVYQANTHGGVSTHEQHGGYEGSYDLEFNLDLEKIAHWQGGTVYALAEGSWSNGINEAVGSFFVPNFDDNGDQWIDLTELYYEQAFLDGKVRARVGKVDLRGGFMCRGCPVSFDGNAFANDETTQFLNGALRNDPTIPFPDRGLGTMLHAEWLDGFYTSAAVADAQAKFSETGFNTTFEDDTELFSIYETGFVPRFESAKGPLQGAYRFGFWYAPHPRERLDSDGFKSDSVGFYTSFDQMLWRENANDGDTQGLGVFNRLGWSDPEVDPIKFFWSFGVQYQGLLPGRDNDVLAFGEGQGRLSQEEQAESSAQQETVLETYYNIQVTPWLHVSPDIQVILNPGAVSKNSPAVVLGIRAQMTF